MWSISEAMEWIKLSLIGVLIVVIPILYLLKKSELNKKAKKEAGAKMKADQEREVKMEFYRAGAQLYKMKIEEKKQKVQ